MPYSKVVQRIGHTLFAPCNLPPWVNPRKFYECLFSYIRTRMEEEKEGGNTTIDFSCDDSLLSGFFCADCTDYPQYNNTVERDDTVFDMITGDLVARQEEEKEVEEDEAGESEEDESPQSIIDSNFVRYGYGIGLWRC